MIIKTRNKIADLCYKVQSTGGMISISIKKQPGLDVEYGPDQLQVLVFGKSDMYATYSSYVVIAAACRKVLEGMVRISHDTRGGNWNGLRS